jgi:hypothetical protein
MTKAMVAKSRKLARDEFGLLMTEHFHPRDITETILRAGKGKLFEDMTVREVKMATRLYRKFLVDKRRLLLKEMS